MRTIITACTLSLLAAPLWAQTPPEEGEELPVLDLTGDGPPEGTTLGEPDPIEEVPPAPERPDVDPGGDFSADRNLFKEVETDPERVDAELEYQERLRNRTVPRYVKTPKVALTVQALAGVFGAGLVGLLGGALGGAVDDGNSVDPLGGFNGPLIGFTAGSLIGSSLATWGTGQVFDKEASAVWHTSGASLGTVLGGGVAAGILLGIDDGDSGSTVAIISFLAIQTAGALLFGELGEPPPPAAPPPPQTESR
ncbi:MAG: hypothetical protein ACE366_29420 [Bradymonadia bacterium]